MDPAFRATYGRDPDATFAAPGRVNLIGEHVDYNGGRCLPLALPRTTQVAVGVRTDDRVRIVSRQQDAAWAGTLGSLGPGEVTGWAAYAVGVLWALQQDGLPVPGLDIAVDSDVPMGAGLSSSAALECAVALAAWTLGTGEPATEAVRRHLAAVCVRAEGEVAGAPTGGMDQTVSLLARAGHALLLDCADSSVEHVRWQPEAAGLELLVVDTRVQHALTDGAYADRRRTCEEAARTLGVRSLREVAGREDLLDTIGDPVVRRRARHVLTEMARVDRVVDLLRAGDYRATGPVLDASHSSLRDDFEVSCPELDVAVEAAREAGALGARMTGGGFGGSAIALLPSILVREAKAAVAAAFANRSWAPPRFLAAPARDGAHLISGSAVGLSDRRL